MRARKGRAQYRFDTACNGAAAVQCKAICHCSRTYIFTGTSTGAKFCEIDHDTKQAYVEEMGLQQEDDLRFTSQEQVGSLY